MENNPEKQKTEIIEKKGNLSKSIIRGVIIAFLCLIVLSFVIVGFTLSYNKIYNGITINGINIGGLTPYEAKEYLDRYYDNLGKMEVMIKCDNTEAIITGTDINADFDSSKAVTEAYSKGRQGNLFTKCVSAIKYQLTDEDIKYDISYERLKFDSKLDKLISKVGKAVVEPTYIRDGDKLFITTGTTGIEVDEEYIKKEVLDRFNTYSMVPVVCYSEKVTPKKVDMEKIRNEIKTEVQDAKYINNSGAFEVTPQVIGVDFDLAEAKKIADSIDEEGVQFSIELIITMPEATTNEILKDLFKDELSTFTTYFNVYEKERTENVKLSAQFINDTILMPGQEFSYNKTVGERSTERGFQTAKVYQSGQVVDGLGGGICQTSSTLYNAVLLADLEIVERRNHSLTVGYVELGRDATVVYGTTDFRFKNNRTTPVKIEAKISGGTLTIKVLGIQDENKKEVSLRTEYIQTIPYTEKIINDSTLPVGTTKITQTGKKGYKVKTYKIVKQNGEIIKEELLSTDTYAPIVQIKRVGVEPTLEGL